MDLVTWLQSLPKQRRLAEKTIALRNLSKLYAHTNDESWLTVAGVVANV